MKISLNNIVNALSIALDLAMVNSTLGIKIMEDINTTSSTKSNFSYHSNRTAYISLRIGKQLKLNDESYKNLYISAMLHDIGCQGIFDKAHAYKEYIKEHCVEGANMILKIPMFIHMYDIILYHHENYDGSGAMKLKNSLTPIESQIIRLADSIEILYDETIPFYMQKDKIIKYVKKNDGIIFSPKIVEAFLEISPAESFWLDINNTPFFPFILQDLLPKNITYVTLEEFEYVADIFASIIDNKSAFTASHSRGIANLAYDVSKYIGYDESKCLKMKIAGLLHDIGKVAIPNNILDKSTSLTDEEFSIIKSHTYYTKLILDRIEEIPDICDWACNHHEKLNGEGYPRKLKAEEISEEARIIGVCDIYQALTEDRPYRKGMYMYEAFSILDNMADNGFICKNAVKYLKDTLIVKAQKHFSNIQL
ncbi:HD-GYP domain-containing protein [Clostridium butanoliproducens]|uniref:HD-GYP domain-containing protein n=1 Tax=Clostridium butanoliproducens TaxID=2991837 RepID=UPI0024BB4BFB|nr:HD-GYP domain-containing protein [Clostridium butanoliproducens]MDU1349670.1 HD domain-containing protein [Clostridium argentinense]